jgi:hypothetical protein
MVKSGGSLIPIVVIGMGMVNTPEAIPNRHKASPGDCRLRFPSSKLQIRRKMRPKNVFSRKFSKYCIEVENS